MVVTPTFFDLHWFQWGNPYVQGPISRKLPVLEKKIWWPVLLRKAWPFDMRGRRRRLRRGKKRDDKSDRILSPISIDYHGENRNVEGPISRKVLVLEKNVLPPFLLRMTRSIDLGCQKMGLHRKRGSCVSYLENGNSTREGVHLRLCLQ